MSARPNGFLIDTNVVSDLRKGARCDPGVSAWLDGVDEEDVYLSVLVLGEIRRGVEMIRKRDPVAARALGRWHDRVRRDHAARILPIDAVVAQEWGRLAAAHGVPTVDGLLAATAIVHGLTLVTRNTKDVVRTGVACLNPFSRKVRGQV